jgi:hypothetical protein
MRASTLLPATVLHALRSTIGDPIGIERLGGMGQGRVYRARSARQSAIVKRAGSAAEAHFYRVVVPGWPELRRFTPTLLAAAEADGHPWLVLEVIPRPLPPERQLADLDLLCALWNLHNSALPALPDALSPYRPAWAAEATDRALAALPAPDADPLAATLDAMQRAAQPLFAPCCPLSGDPNPANWGLRDDGGVVLYDWERFCRGTPALDLAITVPGLGDMDAFRRVAAGYLAPSPHAPPDDTERLAREIALAKVWSVVEFLANNAGRGGRTEATVAWVAQEFAGWVRRVARDLALP